MTGQVAASHASLYGITDDGQLLIEVQQGTKPPLTETDEIVNGTKPRAIRTGVNAETDGAPWAAGESRYVILMASGAANDQAPGIKWRMLSYDRKTGQAHQIALAPDVTGYAKPPAVPGYPQPHLYAGRVYWLQAVNGKSGPALAVMSEPETGGQASQELTDVWEPYPTSHGLYALSSGVISHHTAGGSFKIVRKAASGTVSAVYSGTLKTTQAVTAMAASDSGVVWIVQDGWGQQTGITGSTVYVLPTGQSTPTAIKSPANEAWYGLVASKDLLGWYDGTERGSQYAGSWDGRWQMLGRASGLAQVAVNGNRVAWAIPASGGAYVSAFMLGAAG